MLIKCILFAIIFHIYLHLVFGVCTWDMYLDLVLHFGICICAWNCKHHHIHIHIHHHTITHTQSHLFRLACNVSDSELQDMLKDSPGSLNFTMFLAMLGELLQIYNASSQSGPSELTKAFQQLEDDRQKPGKLGRERLREALGQGPERLTEGEIELVLQEAPKGSDSGNDEGDLIDYHEFVKQLKCPF